MTNRIALQEPGEFVLANFGAGALVKTISGKFEMRGGTLNDHTEAKEWVSLFMPEVVIRNN